MKKMLLLLCSCLIANVGMAQSILDKLQGTWLCDSIANAYGEISGTDLGRPGKYLEIRIKNRSLTLISSPLDLSGQDRKIHVIDSNFIAIFPISVTPDTKDRAALGHTGYEVITQADGSILLRTGDGESYDIQYLLKRPSVLQKQSSADTVDMGYVLVRNEKNFFSGGLHREAQSAPLATLTRYAGIPRFHFGQDGFKAFFGKQIEIPDPAAFQKKDPDEYTVLLELNQQGVISVDVQGKDPGMKEQIIKAFNKSSKRWEFEGEIPVDYKARLKFHFFFYFGEE